MNSGGKRLRCGYTTGACAALAAQAAATMLLGRQEVGWARLVTPKGVEVSAAVRDSAFGCDFAWCAVEKDAGDDPDVTHGMLVCAEVRPAETPGIAIDGGEGVGRVRREGLDQPVGAAAINRVPRRMIEEAVRAVCDRYGYEGGLSVVVSVPGGEAAAARTFNPRLGIEGGISILGTSGIVEPRSLRALADTMRLEMRLAARDASRLILTPGNYGEAFLAGYRLPEDIPRVQCSNFVGEALDYAVELGLARVYLVGHLGKFAKVAAGSMDTHSRVADGRLETLAAHAAMAGAGGETVRKIMTAATTEACVDILVEGGLLEAAMATLLERLLEHVRRRVGDAVAVEAAIFTNRHGLLAASLGAGEILRKKGD